uniref:Uncharacterized protein n=1 Tax=Pipistrellus kuhlii TaxID=59472 RepID=A0A7J7VBX4_PIPKU|nr:hypothetical protein mPipKuh1_008519 [Pipistrellus kuhlii]
MGSSEREAGRGLSLATSDSMVKQRLGAGWNMLRRGAGARGSRPGSRRPWRAAPSAARGPARTGDLFVWGWGVGGRKGRKKGKGKEGGGGGRGNAAEDPENLAPKRAQPGETGGKNPSRRICRRGLGTTTPSGHPGPCRVPGRRSLLRSGLPDPPELVGRTDGWTDERMDAQALGFLAPRAPLLPLRPRGPGSGELGSPRSTSRASSSRRPAMRAATDLVRIERIGVTTSNGCDSRSPQELDMSGSPGDLVGSHCAIPRDSQKCQDAQGPTARSPPTLEPWGPQTLPPHSCQGRWC